MDEELKAAIEGLDRRLQRIEDYLSTNKREIKVKDSVKSDKKDYSGLRGGIICLIEESFLDEPKSADDVHKELVRRSYHYPKESVREALSRHFMQKRVLTRIKIKGKWAYAKRK